MKASLFLIVVLVHVGLCGGGDVGTCSGSSCPSSRLSFRDSDVGLGWGDDVSADDLEILTKISGAAQQEAGQGELVTRAQRAKRADELHSHAIAVAEKTHDFSRAASLFKAAALVLRGQRRSSHHWASFGTALIDLGRSQRRWGVLKAAAAAMEKALRVNSMAHRLVYENYALLADVMRGSFPDLVRTKKCADLVFCPPLRPKKGSRADRLKAHGAFDPPTTLKNLKRALREPASTDLLCHPKALRVKVSDVERNAGVLALSTYEHAVAVLERCGVVALGNAFQQETIATLLAAQQDHFALANRTGLLEDTTVTVKAGPKDRFNVKTPFQDPFTGSPYINNPIVMSVLHGAMGGITTNELEIATLSHVTSLPRSPAGNWHRDHPDLFPNNHRNMAFLPLLPAHACIAIVPLVNITLDMGPTRFVVKSHIPCSPSEQADLDVGFGWTVPQCPHANYVFDATGSAGSAVLFDMRMMHTGGENRSPHVRPAMYTTYAQKWFFDSVNWNSKHTRSYDRLDGPVRARLARLDTEDYTRTLEHMLMERGVDLAEVESQYPFRKQDMARDMDDFVMDGNVYVG